MENIIMWIGLIASIMTILGIKGISRWKIKSPRLKTLDSGNSDTFFGRAFIFFRNVLEFLLWIFIAFFCLCLFLGGFDNWGY